jgi:AcrR family transcriptional regulator
MNANVLTRDLILDSAQELVVRDGVGHLTLDRVAREAGLSKGGLLYHFASKEELVRGLIARLIHHFESDWALWEKESEECTGSRTRAFVRATLLGTWDTKVGHRPHGCGIFSALMAALANNPELLQPLRERYNAWQSIVESDGISPARATVARLAADGLWFNELLGLAPPSPERRSEILKEIIALTQKKTNEE